MSAKFLVEWLAPGARPVVWGTGDTLEEAEASARFALRGHLEELQKAASRAGRPFVTPGYRRHVMGPRKPYVAPGVKTTARAKAGE